MKALNPELLRWLEDEGNQLVLRRIIKALRHVGEYGEIELGCRAGSIASVTAHSMLRL